MTAPAQTAWEAGQVVFEPSSGWASFPGRKLIVDRVTPSGRAVIGETQYGPDGRKLGSRYGPKIVPFTAEHEAALVLFSRRMEVDKLAEKIRWHSLDSEQLDLALPVLRALTGAPQ